MVMQVPQTDLGIGSLFLGNNGLIKDKVNIRYDNMGKCHYIHVSKLREGRWSSCEGPWSSCEGPWSSCEGL